MKTLKYDRITKKNSYKTTWSKWKKNESECIQLMKEGKEWQETAKKGAGLKMMTEATLLEIKRYS